MSGLKFHPKIKSKTPKARVRTSFWGSPQALLIALVLSVPLSSLVLSAFPTELENLSPEAELALVQQSFADLAHSAVPTKKQLLMPLEDFTQQYEAAFNCISNTANQDWEKSTQAQIKNLRSVGDVKKLLENFSLPELENCGNSLSRTLAQQSAHGAQTLGYAEGRDGALTQADQKGSLTQLALSSQNALKKFELDLRERNKVEALFERFCAELPENCGNKKNTSQNWLLPTAMAATSARDFEVYAEEQTAQSAISLADAQLAQSRTEAATAALQQHQQLHDLFTQMIDKQQEINTYAEFTKQAVLQLKIKLDQGSVSHNCASVSSLPASDPLSKEIQILCHQIIEPLFASTS